MQFGDNSVLRRGDTAAAAAPSEITPAQPEPREKVKILLVDDEPANLLALEALLDPLQQDLVRASSGEEALRRLLEEDFGLILLDVKMSGMDGFETAALIRSRDRTRHTPIIFLTGIKNEEYLFRGYYIGAVDFLFKPIVPEILRSKVSVFVELTRQRAELVWKNRELQESIENLERAQQSIRELNADLERRVAERTAELKWSNDELRQFAYIASHDLQEPLRTVASYSQLLARRFKDCMDADAEQFVEYVTSGVRRMHTLLEDMLAYSRASDLKPAAGREADCEGVLNWVLMNLNASVQESGAKITHDPLPRVRVDESHAVQVLQNLIGNAIKYRSEAPPQIHIGAEPCGEFWELSVRDNGIGIEPEYQHQIFGIFKRLHGKDVPGTGIGLAICKKVVERYGGKISVESKPGEGSVFRFTLPG